MSGTSNGQSFIVLPGARVEHLARCSLAAVRRFRRQEEEDLHRRAIADHKASLGYRWSRWFWGKQWHQPSSSQILDLVRKHDQLFWWRECKIDEVGQVAEETALKLLKLAQEIGPRGMVHVTAADLSALWTQGQKDDPGEGADHDL